MARRTASFEEKDIRFETYRQIEIGCSTAWNDGPTYFGQAVKYKSHPANIDFTH